MGNEGKCTFGTRMPIDIHMLNEIIYREVKHFRNYKIYRPNFGCKYLDGISITLSRLICSNCTVFSFDFAYTPTSECRLRFISCKEALSIRIAFLSVSNLFHFNLLLRSFFPLFNSFLSCGR